MRYYFRTKPLAMVWRVEKGGRILHIVGTAHFFPYSFRRSLRRLIRSVNTVIFEGPLDEESSGRIAAYGRQGEGCIHLLDLLTPEAAGAIERKLSERLGSSSFEQQLLSVVKSRPAYLESLTKGMRPWAAFFSIWQTCLNWKYSVDMEAYMIARKLGKQIRFLETIEEQLAVLDNIPADRHAMQLNDIENLDAYTKAYVRLYLDGELEKLMELSRRFVTRIPASLAARDRIFFDRMKPIIESSDVLACLGFPHIPGVTQHFRDAGYAVTRTAV